MKLIQIFVLGLLAFNTHANITLIPKEDLTRPLPVMIVADNQFTNLMAYPHLIRTKMIDKIISVSIRPPQLDLFSRDIFEYTLKNHAQNKNIIHLGDALNLGCKNEWRTFTDVMNSKHGSHKSWVMAPGNHDFFFYGNGGGSRAFKKTNLKNLWEKICQTDYPVNKPEKYKTHLLSKDVFVEYYLNELESQDLGFSRDQMRCHTREATKDRHEPDTLLRVCFYQAKDPNAYLQKVYTILPLNDDLRVSYKSLLVQELNLSSGGKGELPVKAILMDSTDYPESPLLPAFSKPLSDGRAFVTRSQNAGLVGSFRETQLKLVRSWMERDSEASFLLMAHHPYDTFNKASRVGMDAISKDFPNSIYVSAHTHSGYHKKHDHVNELNLGSMTDFKPQYLELEYTTKSKLHFKRTTFDIETINDPILCDEQYNETGKELGYTAYKKARNGAKRMYDFTLSTIERSIIKVFEAIMPGQLSQEMSELGPLYCRGTKCRVSKLEKVKELLKLDHEHLRSEEFLDQRLRYGSCQVIWAATAEDKLTRKEK